MSQTKQETVNNLVKNWQGLGAPDPALDKYAFVRWAKEQGYLPGDQPLPSGARMVRDALRLLDAEDDGGFAEEPPAGGIVIGEVRQQRYRIDTLSDGRRLYVFYPRKKHPFGIMEEYVQAMKRAYANKPNGLGWTINQVCKHWRIGRKEFMFIAREMGWTHDQDEFTREEHLELDVEQLIEDREQRSRWQLEQKAKQKDMEELRRLAALGVDFEHRTEALRVAMQNYTAPDVLYAEEDGETLLLVPFSDLHLGAPGTENVIDNLFAFLDRLPGSCQVMPVWNGDLFHVDNPRFQTTRGTPQDAITYEPYRLLELTYTTGIRIMEKLTDWDRELLPTVVVAGNHDEMACYHWAQALRLAGYVTDDQAGEALKVVKWNDELLVFEHGDGCRGKPENFLLSTINRHRALVGETKRTSVYTGHLHHVKQLDIAGAIHHQLSSPEHSSRWSRKNGYEGQQVLQAFEYDSKRGLQKVHWHILA